MLVSASFGLFTRFGGPWSAGASLVCGAAAWHVFRYCGQIVDTETRLGAGIGVLAAGALGVTVYAGLVALLKVDEAAEVWGQVTRRFRRKTADRRPQTADAE